MDLISGLFSKGQYEQCLQRLNFISNPNASLYESFLIENNVCVCQALIDLVCGDDSQKVQERLLKLNDNLLASCRHACETLPITLLLTSLFNCQWFALSTLDASPKFIDKWDSLQRRIISCCVLGESTILEESISTDPIDNLLLRLSKATETLTRNKCPSTGISIELTAGTLLNALLTHRSPEKYSKILNFITSLMENSLEMIALSAIRQESISSEEKHVFKLGFNCGPSRTEVEIESAFSLIALLGCTVSIILKEKNCRKKFHLAKAKWPSLFNYCEALRHFQNEEMERALGMLLEGQSSSSSADLRSRYKCLQGRVYSALGERHKALENLHEATQLNKKLAIAYFYQGREYGKMGLHDSMLKSYQNLVMAMDKRSIMRSAALPVETRILELIHDTAEITKPAAIYVLAVAYGINEMFEEATTEFEKLLSLRSLSSLLVSEVSNTTTQIETQVKVPHTLTILHEAAAVNLLTGNLVRAEEICRKAMSIYPDKEQEEAKETDVHGSKDTQWIRSLLAEEFKLGVEESSEPITYYEQYLSFFEEDVVGLLLLANLQRIQDTEEGRLTLNQGLLVLSKYIARAQKEKAPESQLTLVKALTSKICLHIARMQAQVKPFNDVDKMFKRALSCNNGDKDVLYHYASFLLAADKPGDADRLWKTFFEKEPIVKIEQAQSLALRYLLRTQISQRQIASLSSKLGIKT